MSRFWGLWTSLETVFVEDDILFLLGDVENRRFTNPPRSDRNLSRWWGYPWVLPRHGNINIIYFHEALASLATELVHWECHCFLQTITHHHTSCIIIHHHTSVFAIHTDIQLLFTYCSLDFVVIQLYSTGYSKSLSQKISWCLYVFS